MSPGKVICAKFYSENAAEPVRDWLKGLDKVDKKKIGEDIKTVEQGWPVGLPTCDSIGQGLYEVRTNLENRIARVLFFIEDGEMILLHGFIKKTRRTSDADKKLARTRMTKAKLIIKAAVKSRSK